MISAINIAGSGMTANKDWLEVTANNIANINTTRTAEGGPYHRQTVVMQSQNTFDNMFNQQIGSGVKVTKVLQDPSETVTYDPTNPDADKQGNVRFPAINLAAEMTNMMQAQRSYEANATSLDDIKKVMEKEMEIGKV